MPHPPTLPRRRHAFAGRGRLGFAVLLAGLVAAVLQQPTAAAPWPATSAAMLASRPNVVLMTTDDQTLADLAHMPRTRRLIGNRGVAFRGLSNHPLCCPARAEILTGQFAQNNGVRSNTGTYGGYKRLRTGHTIATWMNRAGYRTIFMGKYLNGYRRTGGNRAARGWDDWNATLKGVYNYREFTVSHTHGVRTYRRYQTGFFTDLAATKIRHAARRRAPFFLWQSYMAPHHGCPVDMETKPCWRPPKPAARHRHLFPKAVPPGMRTTAYNEADISDKPFPLNQKEQFTTQRERDIIKLHRRRLQSLQAVDEGVARIIGALRRTRELRNTVVIFTSDNGYLLGEHRYVGKVFPYEPSVQVPLLIRGPGLPHGLTRKKVATLVDLAPTIAAVGDANPSLRLDGRNLLPVARRNAASWETVLIQAGQYRRRDEPYGWFYRGVRTRRYTYAYYPYRSEHELYDRARDPHQLDNRALDVRYQPVLSELQRRAAILGACAGAQCRQTFGPLPKPLPAPSTDATLSDPAGPSPGESPPPSAS